MADGSRLSNDDTVEVDVGVDDLDELRGRAERIAPADEATFLRYLVYLGTGYTEAEAEAASSPQGPMSAFTGCSAASRVIHPCCISITWRQPARSRRRSVLTRHTNGWQELTRR